MTAAPLLPALAVAAAFAAAGIGFGRLYFAALRRTAVLYAAGQRGLAPAALTLGRIAAAVLGFALAVRFGALPLLAAFAGFLAARTLALRGARGVA